MIILPPETREYVDRVKVWSLDQEHQHHQGLLEMQNLGPLPSPTESFTLGAGLRNPSSPKPSGWFQCLLTEPPPRRVISLEV